ncbi:MAG: hypothetical protein J6O61_07325 [Butyrivibrio sp.]|nr:hypothetical protein [Butyrivibrio sp.]
MFRTSYQTIVSIEQIINFLLLQIRYNECMCGRYYYADKTAEDVEEELGLPELNRKSDYEQLNLF